MSALGQVATDLQCNQPGCTNAISDNAWARIKADGWFMQKYDGVWCPDHIPSWVEAWRKNQLKDRA